MPQKIIEKYSKFLPNIKIPMKLVIEDGNIQYVKNGDVFITTICNVVCYMGDLSIALCQHPSETVGSVNDCFHPIINGISIPVAKTITTKLIKANTSLKAVRRKLKQLGCADVAERIKDLDADITEAIDVFLEYEGVVGFVLLTKYLYKNRTSDIDFCDIVDKIAVEISRINNVDDANNIAHQLQQEFLTNLMDSLATIAQPPKSCS